MSNEQVRIDCLAKRFPLLVAKDPDLSAAVIDYELTNNLAQVEREVNRGFRSFSLTYRPPRIGRNPKSGAKVDVPAKHIPHFNSRHDGQCLCR